MVVIKLSKNQYLKLAILLLGLNSHIISNTNNQNRDIKYNPTLNSPAISLCFDMLHNSPFYREYYLCGYLVSQ